MTPKFIAIMMTHNRFDLLERTINSWNKCDNLPPLHIFDDGSDDKVKLMEVLCKFKEPRPPIQIHNKSNCSKRTRRSISCMFEMLPSLEGVINLNSDMVFNPNWYTVLMERYEAVQKMDKYLGAISVYNYKGHKPIQSINLNAEGTVRVLRKQSIGIFGCLVLRHFWSDCIEALNVEGGWEYSMSKLAKGQNWNMYCTMPSYVQHTGTKDGVHAHRSVYARDFIGE